MANDNDKFVIQVSLDTTQAQQQLKNLSENVKKNLTGVTEKIKTVVNDNGVSKTITDTSKTLNQQLGNMKKTITEFYSDGKLKSSLTEVKLVNDQINKTLKNNGNFVTNQLKTIAGIGLGFIGANAIISGISNLTQSGLQTTSFSTGFNTNTTILQQIEQLFRRTGGTSGEADSQLANLYTRLTNIQGDPALSQLLNSLGLGNVVADQRNGKFVDTGKLLLQIINKLHTQFPNEAQRQGVISYGGVGSSTLRTLANLPPEKIQSLLEQINKTVITPSELAQQTDLAQKFQDLGSDWKSIGVTLLSDVYPVLKTITDIISKALNLNISQQPILDKNSYSIQKSKSIKAEISSLPDKLKDTASEIKNSELYKNVKNYLIRPLVPLNDYKQSDKIPPPIVYPIGANNVSTHSMIQNKYHSNSTVHNNNKSIRIESLNLHGVNNPNEFATNLSNLDITTTGFAYSGGYLA